MLDKVEASFWTMSGTIEIPARAEQVWDAIASLGSLESCHPFVKANPVEVWPGAGVRDAVYYYYSGLVYYREFYAWEDGVGYDLMIGRKDRLSNKVLWRIHACSENKSELTITVCPQGIQGWKKLAYCVPFLVYYRPLIHKYLRSVVSGYKYFLTTGRPVPRNHFGALTPYSPAV